jgi:hypothetical protein
MSIDPVPTMTPSAPRNPWSRVLAALLIAVAVVLVLTIGGGLALALLVGGADGY